MRFIISLVLMLFSITSVFSQKKVIYKGIVKDVTTQEHIPYATVALYNDTSLIDGVSTNEDGEFQLENNINATQIKVSFIGYETYEIDLSEIRNPNNMIINLNPLVSELDAVVIKAEKTTTQLKIDRKIINLGSDL